MNRKEILVMRNSIFRILTANNEIEIKTVRLDNRQGKWFSLKTIDKKLVVSNAVKNTPSTKLKSSRTIGKNEFINVAKNYDDWKNGNVARSEIRNISQNLSYIFAIVNFLMKERRK